MFTGLHFYYVFDQRLCWMIVGSAGSSAFLFLPPFRNMFVAVAGWLPACLAGAGRMADCLVNVISLCSIYVVVMFLSFGANVLYLFSL